MEFHEARSDLAAALRLAAHFGLNEGVCNHFSYALPGEESLYLLNPHGIHWSQIKASDILILDGDGNNVAGNGEAELTAFTIHGRVHKANPKAVCVLHTHMPQATALTCIEDGRLEPVHQNSLRFYDEVAYDPYYGGLAEDAEEGDRIAAALGDKRILFMAHHGVIVAGESIARAFDDLYYLERACEVQLLAMSSGRPLRLIGSNRAAQTKAEMEAGGLYPEGHFNAMKRLLDQVNPGYRD
ncbi:aldolase [Rhodovibrionaceae bacterium A322]